MAFRIYPKLERSLMLWADDWRLRLARIISNPMANLIRIIFTSGIIGFVSFGVGVIFLGAFTTDDSNMWMGVTGLLFLILAALSFIAIVVGLILLIWQ